MPLVLAAADKFRGTATASEVAAAVARAAVAAGWDCDQAPVADGGEGILEALGGAPRTATVRGPLGAPVEAEWRMREDAAVIEMAKASGLLLAGGPEGNDAVRASTVGTGELIAAAVTAGARRIIVGMGGSATTDGGWGCLETLEPHSRLRGVEVVAACDVTTRFVEAAEVFAPQKGASATQVALLRRRLERLAQVYRDDFGVDVGSLSGSGAAGGLAGGLAAIGAKLVPGFELVADAIDLDERAEAADLIVTGEGYLDDQSFNGKSVGGVVDVGGDVGTPVLVIAGDVEPGVAADVEVASLVERFGRERALTETVTCIEELVRERLALFSG